MYDQWRSVEYLSIISLLKKIDEEAYEVTSYSFLE